MLTTSIRSSTEWRSLMSEPVRPESHEDPIEALLASAFGSVAGPDAVRAAAGAIDAYFRASGPDICRRAVSSDPEKACVLRSEWAAAEARCEALENEAAAAMATARHMEQARDRFRAERDALQEAFDDLLEVATDMRPYVPDYFAQKWHHDDDLEKARAFRASLDAAGGRYPQRTEPQEAPDA